MPKTLTIQDFFKRFPDDAACLDHLMKVRFGEFQKCTKCGKEGSFARAHQTSCLCCPCAATTFIRWSARLLLTASTPLQKWFYAMYLFTTTRNGVPAKELQRQLGVTYKTAWRIGHELRKFLGFVDGDIRSAAPAADC